MIKNNYKNKYIKYKNKYVEMKDNNKKGGNKIHFEDDIKSHIDNVSTLIYNETKIFDEYKNITREWEVYLTYKTDDLLYKSIYQINNILYNINNTINLLYATDLFKKLLDRHDGKGHTLLHIAVMKKNKLLIYIILHNINNIHYSNISKDYEDGIIYTILKLNEECYLEILKIFIIYNLNFNQNYELTYNKIKADLYEKKKKTKLLLAQFSNYMISLFKKEIIEEKEKSLLYIMLNYYMNDSVIYNKIKDNINDIITDIKNINSSIFIIYNAIYDLVVVNKKVIIYRKILSLIYIYYIYFEEKSNKLYEIFYKDNLYEKKTFKSEEKPIEPIEPIKSIMIGGNETLFNTVANLIENNIPYRNMKWKEFIIINDNIYIQKNSIYYIKKILNDIFYFTNIDLPDNIYITAPNILNFHNTKGQTLLHIASYNMNYELMQIFLNFNINIDIKKKNNETPLYAFISRLSSIDIQSIEDIKLYNTLNIFITYNSILTENIIEIYKKLSNEKKNLITSILNKILTNKKLINKQINILINILSSDENNFLLIKNQIILLLNTIIEYNNLCINKINEHLVINSFSFLNLFYKH
jgi:hypothetical protein